MRIGTKSLLFGIHNPLIHTLMIALAWRRLYGFPTDLRLWTCFVLHDIGYLGKSDMDGESEGQRHPELGAKLVRSLYGSAWGDFCLFHSRFYARAESRSHSKLCVCDKLAFACYPRWLYLWLARLTGELQLYKSFSEDSKEFGDDVGTLSDEEWFDALKRYTLRVVIETDRTYYNHVQVGQNRKRLYEKRHR